MKQEQLIDLPIEWKRGNGLRKSDIKTDGKNKCVLYGELYTKYKEVLIDSNELSKTDKEGTVKSKAGDILIPGTSTAAKEDMLLAREIDEDGVSLGGDINILRPKKALFAQKYVPYYFETKEAYDQLDKYITGATGIIHISNTGIKNLAIPLPSLEEQRRIVGVLDEAFLAIDRARAKTQQNLRSAKELFESYLQEIFENKSPDWEEKKLGDILVKTETVDPTKNPNAQFTYLDVSSVNKENKTIENSTILFGRNAPSRAKKLVKTNDVIFATVRPTHQRVAIIPEEFNKQVCSTGYCILRANDLVDNKLIFYFLLTKAFNEQMEKLQKGASYPAVTDSEVKSIIFEYPKSKKEQQEIVSKLDELRAKTQKLEAMYQKKIDDLDELKKSILQKAFAGELTASKEKVPA